MKKILDMSNEDAKKFLLKSNSYCEIDLPQYFNFNKILLDIDKKIGDKEISNFYRNGKTMSPKSMDDVNYKLFSNKDGKYDWRPLEIIHPVFYVALVNKICEKDNWNEICNRFKEFKKNTNIECCSIPVESYNKKQDKKDIIKNWWNSYEQKSVALSLRYNYMAYIDITNCYGSIYTHSIAWAIETKEIAKKDHSNNLLGNKIDNIIEAMSYSQTNGIPQGSVLMDFIAEIVLGYGDLKISEKIKEENINDYYILRYRDDYRIFAKDMYDIKEILKIITEVLSMLNFKLNSNKTIITDNIITYSLKEDKIEVAANNYIINESLQKSLFNIREFSLKYSNSGSLLTLLAKVYKNFIKDLKKKPKNSEQIVSILVDIMYRNPKTYSSCILILSKIFNFMKKDEVENYIDLIIEKFKNIPNTEYIDIWLQRLTIMADRKKEYSCKLCKVASNTPNNTIWNSNWLNFTIDESSIIDNSIIKEISPIISEEEINPFANYE